MRRCLTGVGGTGLGYGVGFWIELKSESKANSVRCLSEIAMMVYGIWIVEEMVERLGRKELIGMRRNR